MIPHVHDGQRGGLATFNALQRAFGLPLSLPGDSPWPAWDAIAHVCRLPDCEQLKHGMDGPGVNVLPAHVMNLAIDIANRCAVGA